MRLSKAITRGATSQLAEVRFSDLSQLNGAGKTGLTTASFTSVYYHRGLAAATVAVSLDGTMVLGTWKTGGFIEVDSTHLPGLYQIGLPDALVGTGDLSTYVTVVFVPTLASGAPQVEIVIPLQAFDQQIATQPVNLVQILGTALTETAGWLAAGFKKFFNVAVPTSTMNEITLVDTTTTLTNAPPDSATITAFLSTFAALLGVDPTQFSAHALALAGGGGATPAQIWDYLTSLFATPGSVGELLLGMNARLAAGTINVLSPGDGKGNLKLKQWQTYAAAIQTQIQISVAVPVDPTPGVVTFTFQFDSGAQAFTGSVVSYDSLTATAILGLEITSAAMGAMPADDRRKYAFAVEVKLPGAQGELVPIAYAEGKLMVLTAPKP